MKQHLRFLFTLLLAIVYGGALFGQTTVTDELTPGSWDITGQSNYSQKKTITLSSGVSYSGYFFANKNGKMTPNLRLQIKEDFQNSKRTGFYTTASSKVAKKITISLASDHSANTTLLVYGSNTAYNSAEDIFDSEKCGTLLGEFTKTKTDAIILSDTQSYKFIAVRAKGGAALINSISFEWASASAEKTQTKLTFPKDSYSFSTTDDLSSFTGQTPTLKAGESELTGKTITYSKTGDDIFTSFEESTGNLALNGKAGTATVTAKFAGDATYAASSASYTITVAEKGKTATTLSFGADYDGKTIEKHVGEEINQVATLSPVVTGATITYKSSAPEVAEVDGGYVAIYKAGDAVITASYAGDDTYAASEVSYTIHATKVPVTLSLAQTEDFHINYGADEGIKMIENKATLTPAEAGSVKYEISYNSVAGITTIDDKGTVVVDTKKIGNSTIKVSFVNKDANTYADVAPVTYKIYVDDNRAIPTLTFGKESYTFDLGAAVAPFTNQLTAPEGVTVVYSSNSEIATVDKTTGEVTVNTAAVGKATITATFAGNDSYKPATATYMLEVVDPNNMEATFDFEKPEDYGYDKPAKSGKTDLNDGDKLESGKVTLTNVKGATTTTRFKDDKGNLTFRVYTGAVLTVSAPEGYVITKMDFTDNGSQTVSNFDFDSGKLNNKTWTGSAQNVKMTVRANQVFLKKLVVAYAKKVVPTLETLTTAASGFATYAADYDVNYSALGLTTYTIALDEANNKVSYNRFEGVVPAGKAVLVQGTASTSYELTPAEEAADATFSTDLKASDGTVTAADDKVYAFGTLNGKSGFKLVTDGIKIPAKKGYLELTGMNAAKPTFFAFDGIGTGICHIEADAALENAAMYNLAGQRVDKSYKGVVIVNGKKMLRK